ncbi:MAG: hypothetical protein P8Y10_14350 [Gemmatimonadales bacterium]
MADLASGPRAPMLSKPSPLRIQPPLEIPTAIDVKSIEQIAPIELDRVFLPALLQHFFELEGVAGQSLEIDSDASVLAPVDDTRAEALAQNVDGLIECLSRARLTRLRPEHGEQPLARVKPVWTT